MTAWCSGGPKLGPRPRRPPAPPATARRTRQWPTQRAGVPPQADGGRGTEELRRTGHRVRVTRLGALQTVANVPRGVALHQPRKQRLEIVVRHQGGPGLG